MFRVGVIGHFGIGLDLANGQTIKTKIVTEETENFCKEKVFIVDAHGGIKAVIPVIFGSIKALARCKNVILMLTENGLKVSVPVLFLFNKIFKRRVHYVVVGGWLPEFLKKQPQLINCLKSFHKIYVENNIMEAMLTQMGFTNVCVMPNCKRLEIVDYPSVSSKPYKLCTFSRVMREKGIEEAVNAVIKANDLLGETAFKLDIFGQVDAQQIEWFEELKKSFPKYINYGGLVPFNQSTEILKDYFALLFPTYYVGEGFAGTAIDAFSAGVPVIASDWKYNREVIIDGVNGCLFQPKNTEQLTEILISIYNNPEAWEKLKYNCLVNAREYIPENVMKTLFMELV